MIIVYNVWALLVIAIIVIANVALGFIAPAAFSNTHLLWTLGGTVTVIGGGAEILGARARLFFLPVWFLGTVILGLAGYDKVGVIAFAIPFISAVLLVWWMLRSVLKARQ